ncbi:MAG: NAD-dependent epimerase/dehydratase family protein [Deltaproteobacteria bacterium]|nr:MAG: NAD-dependent epimerase/dehydratase family protein [Deltaproteobacteria bacterium]
MPPCSRGGHSGPRGTLHTKDGGNGKRGGRSFTFPSNGTRKRWKMTGEAFSFPSKFADIVALDRGDERFLRPLVPARLRECDLGSEPRERWGENVLVLGGNGFIGIHLIERLLRDPKVAQVTALVRPCRTSSPRSKIEAALRAYDLDAGIARNERFRIVAGFPMRKRFGLRAAQYRDLSEGVDTIIHAAGSTSYTASYLSLRPRWVLGMFHLLHFALDRRVKQLCYVGSTIAHLYREREDFQRPDSWWFSGYAQMKWVIQGMLRHLQGMGMRISVCEAPYVLGGIEGARDPGLHYSFWRMALLVKRLGVMWPGKFPAFVPVDLLVEALVRNIGHARLEPLIRPIFPGNPTMADLSGVFGCRVVPWEDFMKRLKRVVNRRYLRMFPPDMLELIERTNLPAIFPEGGLQRALPPVETLFSRYLDVLSRTLARRDLLDIPSVRNTSDQAPFTSEKETARASQASRR